MQATKQRSKAPGSPFPDGRISVVGIGASAGGLEAMEDVTNP